MLAKKKSPKRASKKAPLRPVRLAQRRKKIRLIISGVGVALLVPIFVGIAWGSYHPRLNIQSVEVSGTNILNEKTIMSFLESKLDDGRLHIFSPRNELLLARDELASALVAKYTRIKSVEIPFTRFRQKMIVNIVERKPRFAWCYTPVSEVDDTVAEEGTEELSETCYLVDTEGYIFAQRDGENDLQIIRSVISGGEPLRSRVAEEEIFKNLKIALKVLQKEVALEVLSIKISESDAFIYLTEPWFIKIALDSDIDYQISNLKTILDSQELRQVRQKLKYIDLRFGNRVYYKLYGE